MSDQNTDHGIPKWVLALPGTLARNNVTGAFEQFDGKSWRDANLVAALQAPVTHSVPASIGWDSVNYPLPNITLIDPGGLANPAYGSIGITPTALFDLYSTARSAPGTTIYLNISTGNDSNSGLTPLLPVLTAAHAQTLINTAGLPGSIIWQAGTYNLTHSLNGVIPTVDTAYIAQGGRVTCGTFGADTLTADGTFTNSYSGTYAGEQIIDLESVDEFGNYVPFQFLGSAAGTTYATVLNATSGINAWAYDSSAGKTYARRADGTPIVLNTNTQMLKSGVSLFTFSPTIAVNIYMGGNGDPTSGFDLRGGDTNGPFSYVMSSPSATRKIIVVESSSAKYSGYRANSGSRGFAVDSFNGAAFFFSCDASYNFTDGFNPHDNNGAAEMMYITINCSGSKNGDFGTAPGVTAPTSCNAITGHDDCKVIDIAGNYEDNHGGSARFINSCKAYLLGTRIHNDLGDFAGGFQKQTGIAADNTATIWTEQTKVDMPARTWGYYTSGVGATILQKNVWPTRAATGGLGTNGTFV